MKLDGNRVLAAGLGAMKQNALPGLALWLLALLLVGADWLSPSAHAAFQSVGLWKSRYGLAFSATTTAFFGGVVPFLFLLLSILFLTLNQQTFLGLQIIIIMAALLLVMEILWLGRHIILAVAFLQVI